MNNKSVRIVFSIPMGPGCDFAKTVAVEVDQFNLSDLHSALGLAEKLLEENESVHSVIVKCDAEDIL